MISRISSNWINFGEILKIFDWLGYFAANGRDAEIFWFSYDTVWFTEQTEKFRKIRTEISNFEENNSKFLNFRFLANHWRSQLFVSKIIRIFGRKIANFWRILSKILIFDFWEFDFLRIRFSEKFQFEKFPI